ncbi:MAG: hypothetical protein H7321_05445 [Bacteroidia bacterium]|nr:hypothetical protein [Bacteroidia bacterium]
MNSSIDSVITVSATEKSIVYSFKNADSLSICRENYTLVFQEDECFNCKHINIKKFYFQDSRVVNLGYAAERIIWNYSWWKNGKIKTANEVLNECNNLIMIRTEFDSVGVEVNCSKYKFIKDTQLIDYPPGYGVTGWFKISLNEINDNLFYCYSFDDQYIISRKCRIKDIPNIHKNFALSA